MVFFVVVTTHAKEKRMEIEKENKKREDFYGQIRMSFVDIVCTGRGENGSYSKQCDRLKASIDKDGTPFSSVRFVLFICVKWIS